MDVDSLTDTGPIDAWEFMESFMDGYHLYFRAWIYGLYASYDKGRQALWIDGGGQNGKTTMCKAIEESFPASLVGVIPGGTGLKKEFAGSTFFGKRLATCSDCKNTTLLQGELIHAILGGDSASIEFKGKDSFRGNVFCKLLICSNFAPDVTGYLQSEKSRCIYIHMRQRTATEWIPTC